MSIPEIVVEITSSDPQKQLVATQAARKLLSKERNPPIDDVIQAGVIPHLVQFLKYNDRYLLFLSSHC